MLLNYVVKQSGEPSLRRSRSFMVLHSHSLANNSASHQGEVIKITKAQRWRWGLLP